MNASAQGAAGEWHCGGCGALLGVDQGGAFHMKWKLAHYVVTGPAMVTAVCRRCREVNKTVIGKAA